MTAEWLAVRLIERPRWHLPVEHRACATHPAVAAEDRCDCCGQPYCRACLRHVARWRLCLGCIARLHRERLAELLPARLHRARPEVLAAIAIVALSVVAMLALNAALGGASYAQFGTVGRGIGGKLGAPAAQPAANSAPAGVWLAAPLPPNHPPSTLSLAGAGFYPGEAVRLSAVLDGHGLDGARVLISLGPANVRAGDSGALTATMPVTGGDRLTVGYSLRVLAVGSQGDSARLEARAGGR